MRFRTIICTALLALTFSVTAFGAEHTAQVVSFGHSVDTDAAIELTGSKVITDDFSFKMPDGWSGNCVMVADGSSYEIYNKTAYEEDGSGLLFSIICYEDVEYQDLEDTTSREYKACAEASKVLKKSFVPIVKEPTE